MKRKRTYKRLSEAYKRLNKSEYRRILKECMLLNFVEEAQRIIDGLMALHDYEGEFICLVSKETTFKVVKHHYKGKFFGWNLYASVGRDLKLLETYDSKRKARNVVDSIKKGLRLGAKVYRVPGN